MRRFASVLLCALIAVGVNCPGKKSPPKPVDPRAALDSERTYTIEYWDVEPPWALDPKGLYKPAQENLLAEFSAQYPAITVETRWLKWYGAEDELNQALREGNPPDIWADWHGVARRDHVLQVPAGMWLNQDMLTPAGRKAVLHQGQVWAWPRWIWPHGLLTVRSALEASDDEVNRLASSRWNWEEFGLWLQNAQLDLGVMDWDAAFSSQALLAATGHGFGQWGGQELNELYADLALLAENGLVTNAGAYRKIPQGKIIIGGAAPALVTWLAENLPSDELVLLPVPGVDKVNCIPVSSANLLQFRQLKYKGDDHTRAAAMLGEYLAFRQGEIAAALWAAPACREREWAGDLPSWYVTILKDAIEIGVPLEKADSQGRKADNIFRENAGPLLSDFWAGKADAVETAQRLEELQ